jgi:hypothetical protein
MAQKQQPLFKITTSEKAPTKQIKSLIYHNGHMLNLTGTEYLGKNGKIKAGWYYVYLQNNIDSTKFADEFNKLNYQNTDKKVETVSNYIINSGLINKCILNTNNLQTPQLNISPIQSTQIQQMPIEIPKPEGMIPTPLSINQTHPEQTPVYQSNTPQKQKSTTKKSPTKKSPSKKSPQKQQFEPISLTPFTMPQQSNIISPINKITIECSTGVFTYETPIDKNILNEIINNISTK